MPRLGCACFIQFHKKISLFNDKNGSAAAAERKNERYALPSRRFIIFFCCCGLCLGIATDIDADKWIGASK